MLVCVDPTPHSCWSMARNIRGQYFMISDQDALTRSLSLKTFVIGEHGRIRVWQDDDALGIVVFKHSEHQIGLFGWCKLTSWEVLLAVTKVIEGNVGQALESIMSWLDYREPLNEPDIMTTAEFCKWSLNCVVEHCDSSASESVLWKNHSIATDIVAKPLNKNRIGPWHDRVIDRIGKGKTWDCIVNENMFVIQYRYKSKHM
jgi:hypothetical protein